MREERERELATQIEKLKKKWKRQFGKELSNKLLLKMVDEMELDYKKALIRKHMEPITLVDKEYLHEKLGGKGKGKEEPEPKPDAKS